MGQNKDESKLVTTTVRDYDLGEVSKLVRAVYMGLAMMAFMHLYLKYVSLLFLHSHRHFSPHITFPQYFATFWSRRTFIHAGTLH